MTGTDVGDVVIFCCRWRFVSRRSRSDSKLRSWGLCSCRCIGDCCGVGSIAVSAVGDERRCRAA